MLIGIKSSLKPIQIENKIFPGLKLLELHLYEEEVKDGSAVGKIKQLLAERPDLQLMLHSPVGKSTPWGLAICDEDLSYLEQFYKLCKIDSRILGAVMHTEYKDECNYDLIERNLASLRAKYTDIDDVWYFENLTREHTNTRARFEAYVKRFNLKRLTIDFTHFTMHQSCAELASFLSDLEARGVQYYVHIGDNIAQSGNTQPMNLGKGNLDFSQLAPLVHFGIIETTSDPEDLGREIKEDYHRFLLFKTASAPLVR